MYRTVYLSWGRMGNKQVTQLLRSTGWCTSNNRELAAAAAAAASGGSRLEWDKLLCLPTPPNRGAGNKLARAISTGHGQTSPAAPNQIPQVK